MMLSPAIVEEEGRFFFTARFWTWQKFWKIEAIRICEVYPERK